MPGPPARYQCRAIGTGCLLVVTAEEVGPSLASVLDGELARVDRLASRFRPDSEVSLLNADPRATVPVSEDLHELLAAALWAAEATQGATDPTVAAALVAAGYDRDFDALPPDRALRAAPAPVAGWQVVTLERDPWRVTRRPGAGIDLGATAKAVTADRAAAAVAAASGLGALVSLGGDIAVAGPVPEGGWNVGVADQWWAEPAATVALMGGGMATSSTTARHWKVGGLPAHHLIDPRTGRPATGPWRTVTVIAADCLQANAASTAAIVKGRGALAWLEAMDLPARLVARDGKVTTTSAWPALEGAAPC